MTTERTGTEGFTMVEVMAAILILSIGLLALTSLGVASTRMMARAERLTEHNAAATALTERVAREIRSFRTVPTALLTPTQLRDGSQMVASVQSADADAGNPGNELFTIVVVVRPGTTNGALKASDSLLVRTDVFRP